MFSRGCGLIGCLLIATAAASQTPASPSEASAPVDTHATFRSSVDLVTLSVTVTDAKDRHVGGLTRSDFQVFEDGVAQDLTFFAANQVPLDVALLIDLSSSMREKLPMVTEAASRFVKTLRGSDRAEVVGFNSQVKVLEALTSDQAALNQCLGRLVARGGTSLYTAIYVTLDRFMHRASSNGEVRRPAIVVLTDGEDTTSLIQFDDLLDRARRAGVAIYSIAAMAPAAATQLEEEGSRRYMTESDFALRALAKETGGRAFFPLKLTDLKDVYASVADELSLQYALGYAPQTPRVDGSFHSLRVRLVSRPDLQSRTRMGYYSPRVAASLSAPPK